MKSPKILFCLFIFLFSCESKNINHQLPKHFRSKVIAVKDGDTIDVLYDNIPVKIRFAHIDCPEIKNHQPFGQSAKKFTSDICFGQTVTVNSEGKFDRYNRLIAVIINENNKNVNKELIKAGLAWHFKKYSSDSSYASLENAAKIARVGLWADEFPIPPWIFRQKRKLNSS